MVWIPVSHSQHEKFMVATGRMFEGMSSHWPNDSVLNLGLEESLDGWHLWLARKQIYGDGKRRAPLEDS